MNTHQNIRQPSAQTFNMLLASVRILAFGLVVIACQWRGAQAAIISQTQAFGQQQSPFDQSLTFNRFNPALGVLNSVRWSIFITNTGGSLIVDNDAATAATVQSDIGAIVHPVLPASATSPNLPSIGAGTAFVRTHNLAAENGDGAVVDGTGPDGVLRNNPTTLSSSASGNSLVLNDYVGTSTFNVLARVTDMPTVSFVSGAQASDIQTELTSVMSQGSFQLDYDYSPVPEPSSAALVGFVVAVTGLLRRRIFGAA